MRLGGSASAEVRSPGLRDDPLELAPVESPEGLCPNVPQGGQLQGNGRVGLVVRSLGHDSLMRMVATLLSEQADEWQVSDRRYFSVGSMARVDAVEGGETPKELLAAIA